MKSSIKFFAVLLMCAIFCGIYTLSVFADTSNIIDGLQIEISTDNSSYSIEDDITVTVRITNNNDIPVNNLSIETLLPEGYEQDASLTGKSTIEILNPGEVFTVEAKLCSTVEITEEVTTNLPTTDVGLPEETVPVSSEEDSNKLSIQKILLIIVGACTAVAIAVVIVIICKVANKKTIAMILCILMVGGTVTPALAMNNQSVLTLSHSIPVGDSYISVGILLSYDRIDGQNVLLSIDTSNMMYDYTTDMYYLSNNLPVLSGSLSITDGVETFGCIITDANGNVLLDKTIVPNNIWSLEDVGMIVGVNHIKLSVSYNDGYSYEKNYTINNIQNMCNDNSNTCTNMIDKYNNRYLSFYFD